MPIFGSEEERREYIKSAKDALVRPDQAGYIALVKAFTIAEFEPYVMTCCARYDPAILDKAQYTEFADCNFCLYFKLACPICPVEFYSEQVAEAITGRRLCDMMGQDTDEEKIDVKYYADIINHFRDEIKIYMKAGGFENWRKNALELLGEKVEAEIGNGIGS